MTELCCSKNRNADKFITMPRGLQHRVTYLGRQLFPKVRGGFSNCACCCTVLTSWTSASSMLIRVLRHLSRRAWMRWQAVPSLWLLWLSTVRNSDAIMVLEHGRALWAWYSWNWPKAWSISCIRDRASWVGSVFMFEALAALGGALVNLKCFQADSGSPR